MKFVRGLVAVATAFVLSGCGKSGGEGGDFDLAVDAASVEVIQGSQVNVGVAIARLGGFEDAVSITVTGLPANVTADPLVIPEGAMSGTLVIRADASAVQGGPAPLTVTATAGELVENASVALLVRGIAGTFDLTYGGGYGWNVVDFQNRDDEPFALALQPDGKVLVGGFSTANAGSPSSWAITRLEADGFLDTSFGSGTGKSILDWGTYAAVTSLAVQADGRILAAGRAGWASDDDFGLARFTADGTLDISFAAGQGKTSLDILGYDEASNLAVGADGSIYVGGSSYSTYYYFSMARFDAAGELDANFGELNNGRSTISISSGNDVATSMKVFADGSVLLGGTCAGQMCLAKVDPDGKPDATFGEGTGKVILLAGTATEALWAMEVMADGRIVVAGSTTTGANTDMVVARFSADGKVDPTFNGGLGKRTVDIAGGYDVAEALIVLADGSVILGGHTQLNGDEDLALARVDEMGVIDLSFGTTGTGTVFTEIGPGDERIRSMMLDASGRILVAGWLQNGPQARDWVIARYWP